MTFTPVSYRNLTWTEDYSVLYIDNPVGAGFSFTGHDDGYTTNEEQVSNTLRVACFYGRQYQFVHLHSPAGTTNRVNNTSAGYPHVRASVAYLDADADGSESV